MVRAEVAHATCASPHSRFARAQVRDAWELNRELTRAPAARICDVAWCVSPPNGTEWALPGVMQRPANVLRRRPRMVVLARICARPPVPRS